MDERRDSGADRCQYRKLKDVRGFFGLSENGFRLYESAGLCHPERDSENGYRVCSLSDAVLMCNAFKYTRLGFLLQQAADVLTKGSLENQLDALCSLEDRLSAEMEELLAKKHHLEHEARSLGVAVHDPLRCDVLEDVSLYCIPIHNQQLDMGLGYDDGCVWWGNAPYVNAGLLVTIDADMRAVDVQHGPVAEERDVVRLRLPIERALHFCNPRSRYVRGIVSFNTESTPDSSTYGHIFSYLRDKGLVMAGDKILHRLLRHQARVDGVPLRYDEVYIPVA